tara:strand:- start:330 stop:512 length:183 start_codon:yes stop_codon:yes gene_type:complete
MEEKTRFQRWKEAQNQRTRKRHLSNGELKKLKELKDWTAKDEQKEKYLAWLRFNSSNRRR